jgi:hypothetical protein
MPPMQPVTVAVPIFSNSLNVYNMSRFQRVRAYSLALTLFSLSTLAQGVSYEKAIDVAFPDEVAGFVLDERKVFPQKDLGVNITYQTSRSAFLGSVYIYNGGLNSIPAGTEAPATRQQFVQVIAELKRLESQGQTKIALHADGEQTTRYPGCGPQFIWRSYEMTLPEATLTSFTYLTAMKNNFVKLRVSHLLNDAQGKKDAERFVQEIRKVLGACK